MKQTFIKNELKQRQLQEIFQSPLIILSQLNCTDAQTEIKILQELKPYKVESCKVYATFLKKFFKESNELIHIHPLSNNLITIFYLKFPKSLEDTLTFINYLKNNKKVLILGASLFSNQISLSTLEFIPKLMNPVLNKRKLEKSLLMVRSLHKISTFSTFLKQTKAVKTGE